jgi:hypothetical protein
MSDPQKPTLSSVSGNEDVVNAGSGQGTIDFTTWVLSLRETVLVFMGLTENPEQHGIEPDLDAAHMNIEVLELIQTKTSGNLTEDEDRLLRTVLYELRVAWLNRAGR